MARRLERPEWMFLSVVAIALVARLVTIAYAAIFAPYRVGGDATLYDELARSLIAGRGLEHAGHQTAIVVPAYPAFVAAVYAVSGTSVIAVQVAQGVLGALAAGLAALMALRMSGRIAGWSAGAIFALYPAIVVWTVQLLTENLFIPLSMLALWLLVEGTARRSAIWFAAAGVALGLTILARSEAAAFVPLVAVAALALLRGRTGLAYAGLIVIVPTALLVPWVARNGVTIGEPALATEAGSVLWLGYGPHAAANHRDGYVFGDPIPLPIPEGTGEAQADQIYRQASVEQIQQDPLLPIKLLPAKAWNMFRPVWGGSRPWTLLVIGGSWAVLLALAVIGVLQDNVRHESWYVYLYIVAIVGAHLLTIAEIRYRMPVEAALAVPAGAGAAALLAIAGRRWRIPAFAAS